MTRPLFVDDHLLAPWLTGDPDKLGTRAAALCAQQRAAWPRLAAAHDNLEHKLQTLTLHRHGFPVIIQHNPARLVNVAAQVDAASIAARPCFLCHDNRPPEQLGIPFLDDYLIICNPSPILPRHLTIITHDHVPQAIGDRWADLLQLARQLGPDWAVLYNSPRCGASAPDHHHVQAGDWRSMPLWHWLATPAPGLSIGPGPWPYALLRASDPTVAVTILQRLLSRWAAHEGTDLEPRTSLVGRWDGTAWLVALFPRTAHRPPCYLDPDESRRILVSPGSVDMAGVVVAARHEDFTRFNEHILAAIFDTVTADRATLTTWLAD